MNYNEYLENELLGLVSNNFLNPYPVQYECNQINTTTMNDILSRLRKFSNSNNDSFCQMSLSLFARIVCHNNMFIKCEANEISMIIKQIAKGLYFLHSCQLLRYLIKSYGLFEYIITKYR